MGIAQASEYIPASEAFVEVPKSFYDAKASTTVKITGDYGGAVFEYIQKYNMYREHKLDIQITDYCLSACTFVLGLVPQEKVCVTEFAIFGFHSAHDGMGNYHKGATNLMWQLYPSYVQDRLIKMGWDGGGNEAHPDFLYIKGTELYPLCGDVEQ